jgi:alkylhydroperoxidase/carboxymuconolactone decarboxylase family protein YurZ
MVAGVGTVGDDSTSVLPVARLAAIDASFGAGVAALAAAIDGDGALTARDKSMLVVAAAAVADPASTTACVAAALDRGVAPDAIEQLALALYLSRGARPTRALLDALAAVGTGPTPDTSDTDTSTTDTSTTDTSTTDTSTTVTSTTDTSAVEPVGVDEVLTEFEAVFGVVPDRVTLLAEHSHAGLEAYHRMRVSVLRSGRGDPLLGELALVVVNAAEHRADFATVHAVGARRLGATDAQLVEAGLCAIPTGGVAAWLAAAEAITGSRTQPD